MSEVSKIKPDVAEAHNALGNALLQLGKLDAAVTSYGRALDLRPDFAEALSNLGRALRKQGRLEEAEAAYRRAIAINPNYVEAHARLGRILFDSDRIKEAFQSFTRFAELSYGEPASNVPSKEPTSLFHEVDRVVFKEGYLNRRINITLFYGEREASAELK